MYSQKWNCAASFPVPTFKYLWAIHIFPGSICILGWSKIGRPILGIYKSLTVTWMWKLWDRTLEFSCFGNNEDSQFHFCEYVNQNQDIYIGFWTALHLQCSLSHLLHILVGGFGLCVFIFSVMPRSREKILFLAAKDPLFTQYDVCHKYLYRV